MSSPKEKAKELVNKFYQPLGYLRCNVSSNEMWEYAKQCALIAVDEVLDELSVTNYSDDYAIRYAYWSQVKTEIENI